MTFLYTPKSKFPKILLSKIFSQCQKNAPLFQDLIGLRYPLDRTNFREGPMTKVCFCWIMLLFSYPNTLLYPRFSVSPPKKQHFLWKLLQLCFDKNKLHLTHLYYSFPDFLCFLQKIEFFVSLFGVVVLRYESQNSERFYRQFIIFHKFENFY